jgi:hypothetical protein
VCTPRSRSEEEPTGSLSKPSGRAAAWSYCTSTTRWKKVAAAAAQLGRLAGGALEKKEGKGREGKEREAKGREGKGMEGTYVRLTF